MPASSGDWHLLVLLTLSLVLASRSWAVVAHAAAPPREAPAAAGALVAAEVVVRELVAPEHAARLPGVAGSMY